MILEKIKELDIKRVGDMDEGLTAEISEESHSLIFGMVSKKLYSNPIGSIVREITSNCFDAHIEVGNIEDPVIISYGVSIEEGMYIEFQDFGIGMSPDRINKVYRKYFSSTKRESNKEIGGFGLGSKTPLAYTELFYITTVFDGFKYEYIYHKGEDKPGIDSLYGWNYELRTRTIRNPRYTEVDFDETTEEDYIEEQYEFKVAIGQETEEKNGTIIRIGIKDRDDKQKFKDEIEFQLAYFDNVFVKGWGITNDYHIYEGKHFKFRSDIDRYNVETHLCVGKVRYAIDFNRVSIPNTYRKIPVAIKFDIGELPITLSRESVEYNDKSIKLIQDRVKLAGDEIIALFNSQNPEINTLEDWKRVQGDVPSVTFNKEKDHKFFIWAYSGIEKNYVFKPLKDIGIKHAPNNLFFMWECIAAIHTNGTRHLVHPYSETRRVDNDFILQHKYLIVDKEDKTSSYTDLYIAEQFRTSVYLIKRKDVPYDEAAKLLKITEAKFIAGKAKTILGYIRKVTEIVKGRAGVRDGNSTYTSYRASDEWIANYKRSIIESTAAFIRRKNHKIFFRNVGRGKGNDEMTELEFKNRTGMLVYGFKEDKPILQAIYDTVIETRSTLDKSGYSSSRKAFMVIIIARSVEEDIKGAKKTIHWEDFLWKTNFFKKIYTSNLMYSKFLSLSYESMDYRKKYLPTFEEDYKAILKEIEKYRAPRYGRRCYSIPDQYIDGHIEPIPSMMKELDDFIVKYDFKIPLIGSLKSYLDKEQDTEVIDYLKSKKIRLKNKYYLKTKEQLKEQQRDWNYIIGLNNILESIKNPKTNYYLTLNQNQNVSTESEDSNSSTRRYNYSQEDRLESDSSDRGREICEEGDRRTGRYNLEEDSSVQ